MAQAAFPHVCAFLCRHCELKLPYASRCRPAALSFRCTFSSKKRVYIILTLTWTLYSTKSESGRPVHPHTTGEDSFAHSPTHLCQRHIACYTDSFFALLLLVYSLPLSSFFQDEELQTIYLTSTQCSEADRRIYPSHSRRLRVASGVTAPGPALEGAPRFRPEFILMSLSSYILR
jgi:hypothetical protein